MIKDLINAGKVTSSADFLIIGAGTVGLILANELAALGKRVLCLESGGWEQAEDTHPLNAVVQKGTGYAGADAGRARCLGGTSTRWGGALIPFQGADMDGGNWPVSLDELRPFIPKLEEIFGLQEGPYEEPEIKLTSDYVARLAKWPPFRKRNVYTLLKDKIDRQENPEVWINATATQFTVRDGSLTEVIAESPAGDTISVLAKETVIAAGAIESTRLLLLLSRQNPGTLTGKGLGEGFHDHLSSVAAELLVHDSSALNQIVGFRFLPGGGMRNLRFELSEQSALRSSITPCFAHIGFAEQEGGFLALRDIYRALQKRQLPTLSTLLRLVADLPWLTRAVWWRFAHQRLLFPSGARLELHMVIEQAPVRENSITLSEDATDAFGQPKAVINWSVQDNDLRMMEAAVGALERSWQSSPLSKLASLRRIPLDKTLAGMTAGGGVFHPGGSTRFASSPEHGPIASDLRVFGLQNVAVCATSVLPSGGGANPTMMVLLLALRYKARASTGNVT